MWKLPYLLKNKTSYKKTYIYLSFLVFEDNQTAVKRLVEETSERSPEPVVNKKRKAKKLVFPGPTVQDSEEEFPNTPSNQMELDPAPRSRIDRSKWKRKGKIPSGTECTQESSISQMQVPEMPIISEPELELSMSNSNRYKSHSEGSNRHIHEPDKQYYTVYKDKDWEMLPQIHQGVMNSWHILKMVLNKDKIVK
ncbi:hypothetical protein O181_061524 [Austropuccinia psidii MF-1]|uniref:Uncharacterized protein n=1 Tax=Austropuccinia psidii MF-1 TaxID=1389203 RepID=A0A9Q3EIJ3_9BASI|nr:hypothetical protein [Austropuccinia psidii MF-1]